MDIQPCVTANTCFPSSINSFIIQEVDRYENYSMNESMVILNNEKVTGKYQYTLGINNNQSQEKINNHEIQVEKSTSDNRYTERSESNLNNYNVKFTFGHTNTSLNCTTVHFIQKCQVSTRKNTIRGLDRASWETNMRSNGELIDRDDNIKYIYEFITDNTENDSSTLLKVTNITSSCSAWYTKQADNESKTNSDNSDSYWNLNDMNNMLQAYCDLGIRPHNYNNQDFSISCTYIDTIDSSDTFNRGFSQVHSIQTCISSKHNMEYNNINNSDVTRDKHSALVSSGLEVITREYGFLPDCVPKFEIRPIAAEMTLSNDVEWLNRMHAAVKKYNCSNYKGARIPVTSGLNIPMWRYILKDYDLPIIGDYLQFGFPIDIDSKNFQHNTHIVNHKSALQRKHGVCKYIATEVNKKAMLGPFEEKPFEKIHYSPLMARDKPDGGVRVIVDLSWPLFSSVNSGIPDNMFDCMPFSLKYPTIDMVIEKIQDIGPDALLYKVDLERAFTNLRIDPLAYPLCCLQWNDVTYVDVSVAFGLKIGAAACQMCTDVITFKLRQQGAWVINYLDDYIGVGNKHKADSHFQSLLNILQQVGLPVNQQKVEPPSSVIVCLGIQINAKTGVISIPDKKLQEIQEICKVWASKKFATKRQLQQLVGKLLYIHRCIRPARLFVNRILTTLRNAPAMGNFRLPGLIYKDIAWFNKFLQKFNGVVKIHTKNTPHYNVFVDASLQQVGGIWNKKVYSCNIPDRIKELVSIAQLEAANIMLAGRLWADQWKNKKVTIWCDNLAVVHAFQAQKIKDHWLMACCRTMWYISASYNIEFKIQHIYGVDNVNADILSRWHTYKYSNKVEVQNLKKCNWCEVNNEMLWPDFEI